AAWTAAHHIKHWAHGGATALGNLVLLCTGHHGVVHDGEWSITMEEDGFPLFHPPPWVCGDPRRNLLHRPDLLAQAVS
ncbi:MAG: HNH endonuclease, partial [Pseudonocardia sp.]|nr:HNH endonuclease [Pseudonocardia sp.]